MRALVTGAGGGIGQAIAQAFVNGGYEVIGHDIAQTTDTSLFSRWVSGDLLLQSTQDQLEEIAAENSLDAVVLAHGIAGSGSVATIDEDSIRRIMQIDFESCVSTASTLSPSLGKGGGSLVVVSSQAGLIGEANNSIYCAAKFALVGWLRSAQWGEINPRVLCPGVTDTPLLQRALQGMADAEGVPYAEVVQRRNDRTTVGRLAFPSDMGAAALWLAGLTTPALVVAPVTGGEVVF